MLAFRSTFLALCLLAAPALAEKPSKIAFIDTGNTGRSLTAEALGNQIVRERHLNVLLISRAVDLDPFETAPETNAAALLQRHGIDVGGHRAEQLTAQDVKHADLLVTMTAKHRDTVVALYPDAKAKVVTIAEFATGKPADVTDAYGKPMEVYEAMVEQVGGYLPEVLAKAPHKAD